MNEVLDISPDGESIGLFESLVDAIPLYMLPKDPVSNDVLVPALKSTNSLDVMMGYFSSGSFSEIAPGLATYLRRTDKPIRFVISPFLTESDFDLVKRNKFNLSKLSRKIFLDEIPEAHIFAKHTLACFAWLISTNRLQIKIAAMRGALFHPKVWLFEDQFNSAALHGSTNLTNSGLSRNKEQLTLSRDWRGDDPIYHIKKLRREFDQLWSGGDEDCVVLPLPTAIENDIVKSYKQHREPDEADISEIWNKAQGGDFSPNTEPSKPRLKLPSYLVYEEGEFSHQGEAVKAWIASSRQGILEMATGSGKTITSMICATLLQNEIGPILIVVSAPYRPLMEQWRAEIEEFGIIPVNLSTVGGPTKRSKEIRQASRRLRKGLSDAEIFVVSNDTLCTDEFINEISLFDGAKLLIADECHNLGAAIFTNNPPETFSYRLGLSATPVRQYDTEGTQALIDYFGDICFKFTLEQAIGNCLTEYDYHVHFVELNQTEMELWSELTAKISSQAWKIKSGESDSYLDNLLRQRRLVLETASDKLVCLQQLLNDQNTRDIKYTLIYATDKDPEQLIEVNKILFNKGILYRQLTYEETNSSEKTNTILTSFQEGAIQILTAKRVLDEGVNIPQIKLAYILASTTVKRQWVQRRGRLLRKCAAIGKTHAEIHDFVVLPPGASEVYSESLDGDAKKLVRSELERVWEFARLSRNGPEPGGPYEAVTHLENLTNETILIGS